MKKVAGTLKLDQAQYRELEAFSKFGSDLDAATQAVLEKGKRNVEVLKQAQYSPFSVEKQVAIIYLGAFGKLRNVPVNKISEFENNFLVTLDIRHPEILKNLKAGKLDKEDTQRIEALAEELSKAYSL
jgi:F-type H+-transporting ATPase subunit alpha